MKRDYTQFAPGIASDSSQIDAARALVAFLSSPVIIQVVAEPFGILRGKAAVGAYWTKARDLSLT